jgi:hypothetical protein
MIIIITIDKNLLMNAAVRSQKFKTAEHQWFTSAILATWEAEIGRITAPNKPRQKSFLDSILMEKSWVWWCKPVVPAIVESLK